MAIHSSVWKSLWPLSGVSALLKEDFGAQQSRPLEHSRWCTPNVLNINQTSHPRNHFPLSSSSSGYRNSRLMCAWRELWRQSRVGNDLHYGKPIQDLPSCRYQWENSLPSTLSANVCVCVRNGFCMARGCGVDEIFIYHRYMVGDKWLCDEPLWIWGKIL